MLLRTLKTADIASLSGLIFIWFGIASIISGQVFLAILLTLAAFCIDMVDGWIARKNHSTSQFGLQLDTIIDTINYPVFNALFSYTFLFNQSLIGSITAIIILIFSSLRLTRMAVDGIKVDTDKRKFYEGVVTPHILVVNIFLFYVSYFVQPVPQIISAAILITLSILMVSTIKTYKPKNLSVVIILVLMLAAISMYGLQKT